MSQTSSPLTIGLLPSCHIDPDLKADLQAQGYHFLDLEDFFEEYAISGEFVDVIWGAEAWHVTTINNRAEFNLLTKAQRAVSKAKRKAEKEAAKVAKRKKKPTTIKKESP